MTYMCVTYKTIQQASSVPNDLHVCDLQDYPTSLFSP